MDNPFLTIANLPRKIIHIDMDCFYAAIEIRDNPSLSNKPIAVGGAADKRGVICTCNYIARRYGVHSAMATTSAYRLCKDLIVLPVNMAKYQQVAKRIHTIFQEFTSLVEPLALDEAYLEVTHSPRHQGSATLIADAIRKRIWEMEHLTASAGVASNKFLAKIASAWVKPNGLFVIRPDEITPFINLLPVNKLFGVGKVTAAKLQHMNLHTCVDLQKLSLTQLIYQFGKLGQQLYYQCRGLDNRPIIVNRERKSLSVEQTFIEDIRDITTALSQIQELYAKLTQRLQSIAPYPPLKNQYLKIKFSDFKLRRIESATSEINLDQYFALFKAIYAGQTKSIRLLGLGVHFEPAASLTSDLQLTLF